MSRIDAAVHWEVVKIISKVACDLNLQIEKIQKENKYRSFRFGYTLSMEIVFDRKVIWDYDSRDLLAISYKSVLKETYDNYRQLIKEFGCFEFNETKLAIDSFIEAAAELIPKHLLFGNNEKNK